MMKAAIKTAYIAKLQHTYPTLYLPGSKPLQLAEIAADNALSGRLKLEGECWTWAIRKVTGHKSMTMRDLANLPE